MTKIRRIQLVFNEVCSRTAPTEAAEQLELMLLPLSLSLSGIQGIEGKEELILFSVP